MEAVVLKGAVIASPIISGNTHSQDTTFQRRQDQLMVATSTIQQIRDPKVKLSTQIQILSMNNWKDIIIFPQFQEFTLRINIWRRIQFRINWMNIKRWVNLRAQ